MSISEISYFLLGFVLASMIFNVVFVWHTRTWYRMAIDGNDGWKRSNEMLREMALGAVARRDSPEEFARNMVVCSRCGNKRCPGVNGYPCTGSNASGQPGSRFPPIADIGGSGRSP